MNAAEFLATHNPPLVALCVAGRSGAYIYADRALAIEALEEVLRRDPPVDAALAIRGDGDGVIWSPGGRGNWQALGYGAGQLGIGPDHDPPTPDHATTSPTLSPSERAAALILRAWVDCPSTGDGAGWGVLIGAGNLLRMHGLLDRHGDDPTPEGQALLDALERGEP